MNIYLKKIKFHKPILMKNRIKRWYCDLVRNNNSGKVLVSYMQMTTPYYPQSALAKSKFFGFYSLFYIFTVYFSIVYPTLNYLQTGNFFQKALFKIFQTNLYWDIASILIFLLLSFFFMQLSSFAKSICKNLTIKRITIVFITLIGLLWTIYIGIGFYIIRTYPMYFTDKIFIVVMSWAFFIKTLSFIFDMHQIVQITSKFQVKRNLILTTDSKTQNKPQNQEIIFIKRSNNLLEQSLLQQLKTKFIYLVSPQIIFKQFILNHDKNLSIHPIYIINKIFVCFICSLVNLIIMIEILQPLCYKNNLQKYKFIQLLFRFIPPIFYINICLYFMTLENLIPAFAEVTKMKQRIYYDDWWNANTLYQFLDKWVLLINCFTKEYLTVVWKNKKLRETVHVAIILFLIFQIFSIQERKISLLPFMILSVFLLLLTFFFGGNEWIQNNHLVLIIIFAFSPLMLAIEMKFNIFSGQPYLAVN